MSGLKRARHVALVLCLSVMFLVGHVTVSHGKTAEEINASANATMNLFKKEVKGGDEYLKVAKGVLVMPGITKAAFIIGGQYGTGALRVRRQDCQLLQFGDRFAGLSGRCREV